MDDSFLCMLGVLLLVMFVASRFFGGRRNEPAGTYDDPNTRSGGSIGGSGGQPGQRTYDDPNVQSGGSFGGSRGAPGQSTFDDPDVQSGGSFGGGGQQTSGSRRQGLFGGRSVGRAAPKAQKPSKPSSRGRNRPSNDDPNIKSGGSFGS